MRISRYCEKFNIQIVLAHLQVSTKTANMPFPGKTKSNLKISFFLTPGHTVSYSTKFTEHSTLGLLFPAVLYFHPETLSLYSHNLKKNYGIFNENTDNTSRDRGNIFVSNSAI